LSLCERPEQVVADSTGMVCRLSPEGCRGEHWRRRNIGIDLGKTVFHLVGVTARGQAVVRKKCSRTQLLRFTSNLRECLIGMEACGGSHFLGRALREQGHDVRLMPAQYVKPYVKTNKNDYIDAEAIAEAVGRANMRFVPIKSDAQLDMQSLHRVRERWVARRTSVINQIRGLLLERGITFRKGRRHAEASLPVILEDADNGLSGLLRMLLMQLQEELRQLQSQIDEADARIAKAAREHEPCRRLMAIPGVGPLTATAVVASIGNGAEFRKGRSFAAWLGLVPKQESTGGKQKLLGISKRGNPYLRRLFVSGARAVLQCRDKQPLGLSAWLGQLASRVHSNVAAVALANKLARFAWAVLAKSEAYRPPLSAVSTEALACN
jgi:transposase